MNNYEDFSIIIIPDTQNDIRISPSHWTEIANWIVANKTSLNIKAVVGYGDIVDNYDQTTQWDNAKIGWDIIKATGLPFFTGIGNHDLNSYPPTYDITTFLSYFGLSYYNGSWFSGTYEGISDNLYVTFTVGSQVFIIFSLEHWPRDEVLTWFKNLCLANPDAFIIVAVHSIISETGSYILYGDPNGNYWDGDSNDGSDMWNVFKTIPNLRLALCGHIPYIPYTSIKLNTNDGGYPVTIFRSDYQNIYDGHIAILKFKSSGKVNIESYSVHSSTYDAQYNIDTGKVMDWWDDDYPYRKAIKFNASTINTDLNYFPVLVNVSSANFDLTKFTSGSTGGIVFVDADCVTRLYCEVENWVDGVGGSFWVRVPKITANSNYTDLVYMYFGNPSISNSSYNAISVWDSNFVAVYHLKDGATNSVTNDSSLNANNGTKTGAGNPTQIAGILGYGQSFPGVDSNINFGKTTSLNSLLSAMTVEILANPNSLGENNGGRFVFKGGGGAGFGIAQSATATGFFYVYNSTGTFKSAPAANNAIPFGSWTYIAGIYDGVNVLIQTNSTVVTGDAVTGNIASHSTKNLLIGDRDVSDRCVNGILDEFRLSNIARSVDWRNATFLTTTNNFVAFSGTDIYVASSLSGGGNLTVLGGKLWLGIVSLLGAGSLTAKLRRTRLAKTPITGNFQYSMGKTQGKYSLGHTKDRYSLAEKRKEPSHLSGDLP